MYRPYHSLNPLPLPPEISEKAGEYTTPTHCGYVTVCIRTTVAPPAETAEGMVVRLPQQRATGPKLNKYRLAAAVSKPTEARMCLSQVKSRGSRVFWSAPAPVNVVPHSRQKTSSS
jgi:hypothetical protein